VTRLRPFCPADAGLLLEWRNSAAHRRWSFSDRPIDPDEHRRWFGRFLEDPRRIGFILEDDAGLPLGQVRFDPASPGMLRVSIGISPDHLGRGIGTRLLSEAVGRPEVAGRGVLVRAETFLENLPSRRIFEKAGFVSLGERDRDGHRYIEWIRPVGDGLRGVRYRIVSAGADAACADLAQLLSGAGFPPDASGDDRCSQLLCVAAGRLAAVPLDAGERVCFLLPAGEPVIIEQNKISQNIPEELAAAGETLADRAVCLLAWLAVRDRKTGEQENRR